MNRSSLQIVIFVSCALLLMLSVFPEQACAYGPRYGRGLGHLWESLLYTLSHPPRALVIAAYIAGGLCLVYGYKVYQFIVMLPGILIGGVIGYAIGALQWGTFGGIICTLLGASICGALAWALHQFAIWFVGALLGGLAATGVAEGLFHTHPNIIVVIIAALIGGALLLALAKALIIVKSSCIGALLVAYGARSLDHVFLLVGLTLVGIAIQYGVAWALGDLIKLNKQEGATDGSPGAEGAAVALPETALPEVHHAGIIAMIRAGHPLDEIRRYYHQHHNIHPQQIQNYLQQLAGETESQ